MAKAPQKTAPKKSVETLKHAEASRKNIPTAEYQSVLAKEAQDPKTVSYAAAGGVEGLARIADRPVTVVLYCIAGGPYVATA